MTSPISSASSGIPTGSDASWSIAGAGGKLGKQEFLQMLVTQLRYQDPMNPMDGQEFAAQLAQFSSVEQLVQLNEQLAAQGDANTALLQATNSNTALSTIGRSIFALGDQVELPATGGEETSVSFTVGGYGGKARLVLLDESGAEVASRDLGVLGAGRQTIALGDAATDLPGGVYGYRIDVMDGDTKVAVETYMTGRVDGVRYGPDGAVLTAGKLTIPIGHVIRVSDE